MNPNDRRYDIDHKHTGGEHLVTITPTLDTAKDMAGELIHQLRENPNLLSRLVAAAVNTNSDAAVSGPRSETVHRVARLIQRVVTTDLFTEEADVLVDDIGDHMVPPPPCDTDGCDEPEHHQGLCWTHWSRRVAVLTERGVSA